MGTTSVSSVLLFMLNILHVLFGLGITCVALWFFVEVHHITSLRNMNHYLLDYKLYWPQAIPWVFILVGVLVIFVSCCGFVGAKKRSNGLVSMYIAFEIMTVVALIVAAVVAIVFADSKATDEFIKDSIWDVFNTIENDKATEIAFQDIEKRMQCCGASEPRNYVKWRREFPTSCCDTYYHGWIGSYNIDCDFTNKLPNERHGCIEVASNYTRIAIRVLAGAAVFTAFIGIINLIVAFTLSRSMKNKPRIPVQQEFESKKVLL